jgi:hypothetical protein
LKASGDWNTPSIVTSSATEVRAGAGLSLNGNKSFFDLRLME